MAAETLNKLYGGPKIRKFAVLDIEATQWVNPYAIGFYDGRTYVDFVSRQQCIGNALAYILGPEYADYWIYAHNGGNYDFLFLLKELLLGKRYPAFKEYELDITPIQSCMFRVEVKDKKKNLKWTFVDSARLMPIKLDDLGHTFGLGRKVELNISYDDLAKDENKDLMRKYLKADCMILYKALVKLQSIINRMGGQIEATLPSTALDLYRRVYLKEDIYTNRHLTACEYFSKEKGASNDKNTRRGKASISTDDRSAKGYSPTVPTRERGSSLQTTDISRPISKPRTISDEIISGKSDRGIESDTKRNDECKGCLHQFIRKSYYGGRTEIFRMKFSKEDSPTGEAELYDINSHYPNCMLRAMPVGLGIELENPTESQVYNNANKMTGIVDCEVYIPEDTYIPPLPYRLGGKLIFPVGRFRGVWDTAELTLLKKVNGKILNTYKSVWFQEAPIFYNFITTMYKFRDKTNPNWNPGMDWIAKILMNSAYGKFAMREERSKIVVHPSSITGLKPIDYTCDIWSENVFISPNYIVPQISTHVTALARAKLWEILNGVIAKGGKVYYTDTDSVVCSGVSLDTDSKLGGLKLESVVKRAEFVLPKLYLIETAESNKKKTKESHIKVKAKGMGPGIRMTAGDDELAGQLSELEFVDLVKHGIKIDRHRLTKFKEALTSYSKKAMTFPRVIASPKGIQTKYDKRLVLSNYDTKPIVIG